MHSGWREGGKEGGYGRRGKRMEERSCKKGKWKRVGGGREEGVRGRKRLICWGVAGQVWGPVGSTVGVQPATQEVLYVSPFTWWDQLGVTCRTPLNFLKGSLTILDGVRRKYNAALLSESGL